MAARKRSVAAFAGKKKAAGKKRAGPQGRKKKARKKKSGKKKKIPSVPTTESAPDKKLQGKAASLANLRPPWKPGESGNPKGSKPRRKVEDVVLQLLDVEIDEEGTQRVDRLANLVLDLVLNKKNVPMLRELLGRLWPKPLRIQGDPEFPIPMAPTNSEPEDLSQYTDEQLIEIARAQRIIANVTGSPSSDDD